MKPSSRITKLSFPQIHARLLPMLFIPALLAAAACSRHVGASIEVPNIPPPAAEEGARAKLNASIALSGFKDVREAIVPTDLGSSEQYTQPQGPISQEVEMALTRAMNERGLVVNGGAPVTMWGEIRKWRTLVSTTTTSKIQSEAALYVELLDSSGKRIYAGTFHGSRNSQFPVATAEDIKDSLGIAMAQAISQVLEDEELLSAIWR